MLRPILYGILMWLVTIYAVRRGGWEEKTASVVLVVNSYLTVLLISPVDKSYHSIEYAVLKIDLAYLIMMTFVAFISRKFWPMWIAAMAAMVVIAHLLPLMPRFSPFLYSRAEALWSYPMWIVLAIATRKHDRLQRTTAARRTRQAS